MDTDIDIYLVYYIVIPTPRYIGGGRSRGASCGVVGGDGARDGGVRPTGEAAGEPSPGNVEPSPIL